MLILKNFVDSLPVFLNIEQAIDGAVLFFSGTVSIKTNTGILTAPPTRAGNCVFQGPKASRTVEGGLKKCDR